ncbi:O-antigen ligase family protein [Novosphingobium guangzhouense]|uniref:O-antigen ligase family protein n=1 Tax=Novosphingobium guangzhouense TaxID=1850347 RepID=UPI001FE42D7E|nr:O-antigen ligase family protein [Novosphingobium guangzhouense]
MNRQTSSSIPLVLLGMLGTAAALFVTAKPAFYGACASTAAVLCFVRCMQPSLRQDMAVRALLITFFMPAVAWLLPNVWMLYFVMLMWVPVFSSRPEQIVGIYLHSLLLLPNLDQSVELAGTKLFDIGVHDMLALGAVAAIMMVSGTRGAINGARTGRAPRIARGDDWRVGLLLMVMIFASARETSVTHVLRTTINIGFDFAMPYYILSRGLRDVASMRSAMRWFACSGIALSGVLVFEMWQNWPIYNELYWHYDVPKLLAVKVRGVFMRPGGPFNEPTSIALVMALCLLALWLIRDDFRTRMQHRLLCLGMFLGVSAPQSRNAWVALALAVLLADMFLGRWSALVRKVAPTVTALTMILAAASIYPSFSDSLGLSGQASETADYRRALFDRGIEELVDSPIIGFSRTALEIRLEDMRQGEGIIDYVNTYLWFALVSGVIGLVVFVWNLVVPLMYLWRRRRAEVAAATAVPAAFVFSSLAALSATLFFTFFATRMAYLTVGFMGFAAAIRAIGRAWARTPAGQARLSTPLPRSRTPAHAGIASA